MAFDKKNPPEGDQQPEENLEAAGEAPADDGALDAEIPGEGHLAFGPFRICRVERAVEPFHLAFRPVGDGELHGILDHHVAVRTLVKVLTHTPFQKLDVHELVTLGNADLVAEHP